jgi:hypothetical protein
MATRTAQVPLSTDTAQHGAAPAARPEPDFDARWANWVARGRLHEQRVRKRLAISVSVLTVGAAIVYAIVRS